MELVREQHLHT